MAPDKQLTPKITGGFVIIASLGGLAYHLWKGEPFWTRRMVGAVILSALIGTSIACWCWMDMHNDVLKLAAIAVAGGIGGTNIVDVVS